MKEDKIEIIMNQTIKKFSELTEDEKKIFYAGRADGFSSGALTAMFLCIAFVVFIVIMKVIIVNTK